MKRYREQDEKLRDSGQNNCPATCSFECGVQYNRGNTWATKLTVKQSRFVLLANLWRLARHLHGIGGLAGIHQMGMHISKRVNHQNLSYYTVVQKKNWYHLLPDSLLMVWRSQIWYQTKAHEKAFCLSMIRRYSRTSRGCSSTWSS